MIISETKIINSLIILSTVCKTDGILISVRKNHTSQTQVPTCTYDTYAYNQMWLTVGFDVFIVHCLLHQQ